LGVHVLARFAIAATWTSSAAALDAKHIFAATSAVAECSRTIEVVATDVEQKGCLSCLPAAEAPLVMAGLGYRDGRSRQYQPTIAAQPQLYEPVQSNCRMRK